MKNWFLKVGFLSFLLTIATQVDAQPTQGGFSSPLFVGFIAFLVLVLLIIIVMVSDRLMRVTAVQLGADKTGVNYSVFPRLDEFFRPSGKTAYTGEAPVHNLKKGYDIKLEGAAEPVIDTDIAPVRYGLKPTDFIGISPIPKVTVEVEGTVKVGDPLFFDKKRPEIKYAAPVSGQLIELNRGDKRKITDLVILADKEQTYRTYDLPDLEAVTTDELIAFLLESGVWPFIRQRPYNIVAEPDAKPENIFVSTFDSAPLAPDSNFVIQGQEAAFQKGIDVLAKLTEGKVHLGLSANGTTPPADIFVNANNAEKHWFSGVHPSGNVGVQIHHIAPINKGNVVWTVNYQDVIIIGRLFTTGQYNTERVVALTGAELKAPKYVRVKQGACIGELLKDNLANDHVRYVSGDVLTGTTVDENGFLGFYDDQVTVLEEGDYHEMFGWLLPIKPRPSISNTFPHFIYPEKFKADTNTHGEKRALVVTGEYEKVLPMDIYPQHLIKAILVNDFERMEGLGIYELVEEDVALCEFVCTSKTDVQKILRKGLDVMREQG